LVTTRSRDVHLCVCTVTDFPAAEKVRGMKFCVRVRLLSGQVFSHLGELWLAGSHVGDITSGMSYIHITPLKRCVYTNHTWEKNFAARLAGQSELGAAASLKAVWWDLRLASLLTHLFDLELVLIRYFNEVF